MLVVSLMILLVLQNKNEFIYSTTRIKELFAALFKLDFKELKTFFEVYLDSSNIIYDEVVNEVVGGVTDFVEEIITVKESWDVRLVNFLNELDESKYDIDLLLFQKKGLFLNHNYELFKNHKPYQKKLSTKT